MTTQAAAPTATAPQGSAAPAAPSTSAPSTVPATPPAGGAQPPATTPAAPAKPPIDTRAMVELRRTQRERDEAVKKLKDAEPRLALLDKIKDPKTKYAVAKDLGLDYAEWTNEQLSSLGQSTSAAAAPELPPELAAKLAKIDELEAAERARQEAAAKQESDAARAKTVKQAVDWLDTKKDTYQYCAALGMGEQMHDAYAQAVAAQEGIAIDSDEFAAGYEAHIEKMIEAQIGKLAATAKGKTLLQRLLSPPAADPAAAASTTASPQPAGLGAPGKPRALTNGHSSETTAPVDRKKLSDKQLRELAMKSAGMGSRS